MNKVLITGVAGLLGSRLADWLIENHPKIKVVGSICCRRIITLY